MPDQTLAQRVRATYPGAYDDLTDQELESKVKAKFPGAYDDLPTTPADGPSMNFAIVNGQRVPVDDAEGDGPIDLLKGAVRTVWAGIAPFIPGTQQSKDLGQAIVSGEFLKAIPRGMVDEAVKAEQARGSGDYATAARHLLASAIPAIGPILSQQGEKAQQGRPWEAAGEAIGLGASLFGPAKAGSVTRPVANAVKARMPRLASVNAEEAAALRFGTEQGIPLDAATATGNRFVRGTQALADRTPLGSVVAERAEQAQQQALSATGRRLAERAHPQAVTPEQAGAGVQEAVRGQIGRLRREQDTHYGRLRDLEADPANATPVPEGARPVVPHAPATEAGGAATFGAVGSTADELFGAVFADARRNGYVGSPSALRVRFKQKVGDAKGLQRELGATAEDFGSPRDFFEAIRRNGGITDEYYAAELEDLWQSSSGYRPGVGVTKKSGRVQKGRRGPTGGFQGVPGVLRAKGGKTLEHIAENLREDGYTHITGPNVLLDEIERMRIVKTESIPLSDALDMVGVRPGTRWWDDAASQAADDAVSFDPAALEAQAPRPTVQAGVDLRDAKATLRPIYERITRQLPIAQRRASPGLKALENILDGPDMAPLSQVDADLSALKTLIRGSEPGLRSVSQGLTAAAIKPVETAVWKAAGEMGPEATGALRAGREATRAKWAAATLLKRLAKEPVQAYGQLTWRQDSGVARLREIAKLAPSEMPKVGRAFLDQLLEKATGEGRWGHADRLFAEWRKLGAETKRLLFPDAALVRDLDRFFLLAKKMAQNPNPSGTALTAASWSTGVGLIVYHWETGVPMVIGTGALSKLLHSPTMARAIVRAMQTPKAHKVAARSATRDLVKYAGASVPATAPVLSGRSGTVPVSGTAGEERREGPR